MVETVYSYHFKTSVLKTVDNRFFAAGNLDRFGMGSKVTKFTEIDISKWDVVGVIEDIYIGPIVVTLKSIDKEGRGYIYTLGDNGTGALGINDIHIEKSDIPVKPTDSGGSWDKLQGTIAMASADIYPTMYGAFVYIEGNGFYAWGQNLYGMLGTGDGNDVYKPTLIDTNFLEGEKIIFISSNGSTLLMTESGRIFGVGRNDEKQLGLGHNNEVYTFQESNISGFDVVKPEDLEVSLSVHAKYKDNKYIIEGATEEQFNNKLLLSFGGYEGTVDDIVITTNLDTSKVGTQKVTITATDTAREESNENRVATTTIELVVISSSGVTNSKVKTEIETVTTVGDTTYVLSTDKKVYDLDGNVIADSANTLGNIIQVVGGSENVYFLTDKWMAYTIEEDGTINTVNLVDGIQGTVANIYAVGGNTYFLTHNGDLYSSTEFVRSGVESAYSSSDNLVLKTVDGWELINGTKLTVSSDAQEVYSNGGTLIVKTGSALTVGGTTVSGFGSNEALMEHGQISVGNNITVVINGTMYVVNSGVANAVTSTNLVKYANGNYVLTEGNDGSGYIHSLNGTTLEDITLSVNGTIQLPDSVEIPMIMEVTQISRWFYSTNTQEELEKAFVVTIVGNQGDVELSYTGFDPTATESGTQTITITATTKDSEGNVLQSVSKNATINFEVVLSILVNDKKVDSDTITYSKSDTNEVITVIATGATTISYNRGLINSGDKVTLTEGKHEIRAANGTKQYIVTYIVDRTAPEKPTFNIENEEEGQHSKNTVWITDGYDLNLDYTEYKVGDGDFIKGNKVDLVEDGVYIISARTIDKLGHESEVATMEITIDTEAPLLKASGVTEGSFTRNDVYVMVEDKITPVEDLKIIVTIDGTVVEGVKHGDRLSDDGDYEVTVTDLAGLSSTLRFTIDKTPPILVVKNGSTKVMEGDLISELDASGILVAVADMNLRVKEYSINGGVDWVRLNDGDVFKNDGNYVIRTNDKANNEKVFKFSIATGKPKITIRFEEESSN